jgi:signal transduction histidine kinase
MALWYGLLTLVLLAVFLPLLYLTTRGALYKNEEEELRQSLSQLSAQVEDRNGRPFFENEVPLPAEICYVILVDGKTVLASTGDTSVFNQFPVQPDVLRTQKWNAGNWMALDGTVQKEGLPPIDLRVASPLSDVEQALYAVKWIGIIGVPLFLLTAILGGLFIAQRSIQPIQQVIKSAKIISRGDLSERIKSAGGRDEIGDLIKTMNEMIESLQIAFAREKQFTSDASHELRTPVAIIMAYSESLLSEGGLSEEDRKSVETILLESQRIRHIISQLLTLTRGNEGRYPLQPETLDAQELIKGVAAQLADRLEEKDIQLTWDADPGTMIYGDQSLMTQLMLNLLENAIKYGKPQGHVRIAVNAQGEQFTITVQDDGIGIPNESLPYIFERFYRVDTSRDRTGTGLGLSIVKWIVQAHRGTVEVHSDPGKGTVFMLQFPMHA